MTLDSIIERLEKAEGGDRELDCLIGYVADLHNEDMSWRTKIDRFGLPHALAGAESYSNVWRTALPLYTSSVDAAIALAEKVLPSWCWLVRNDEEPGAFANVTKRNGNYEDGVDAFPVWAKTPALALVTSLLKAKQMGVGE